VLLVKKEYFEAIRAGSKRTTLRYWRTCRARAGSVHRVPGLGKVRIDSVRTVRWDQLTDADARADRFADLRRLKEAVGRLYPPRAKRGRKLYQVHFALLRGGDQRP